MSHRSLAALAALPIALATLVSSCDRGADKPMPTCPSPADAGAAAVDLPDVRSGEGMWPWADLGSLDEATLRERGLEVPLADLWTPGKGGLFGAAVGLRGCSASFVSGDGLMITNHHCVFSAIQRNSTADRNLLEDGFVAATRGEELDGQGLRAYVFVDQRDVTARVLRAVPKDATDLERMRRIEAAEKEIVKECEEKPNTRCAVSRNNDGLGFVLLENLELTDVRLVAAPPRSLGEFGGEVDNWRWPRHTMDFSFVRAYVSKDGEPAPYSTSNVPYVPARHFEIGADGVSSGDLVMVVGTPYRTARYRTLASVREDLEWYYPAREALFSEWIEVLEDVCAKSPSSCLPVSSTLKTLNNGLTNARGMIAGLRAARILERKAAEEAAWRRWVGEDAARASRWGATLNELTAFFQGDEAERERDFLIKNLLWGVKALGFARTITRWAAEQGKPDAEREPGFQERDRENSLADLRQAQRSLDPQAERRVLAMFLRRLGKLPPEHRLAAIDRALRADYTDASIGRFVERLYEGTNMLEEQARTAAFGATLESLAAKKDTALALALDLKAELDAYDDRQKARDGALFRLRPPYVESLIEMRGARFYPDANASPRVSFATVTGYVPADGILHTPFTTLSGLHAKAKDEKPFDVPARVTELLAGTPAARRPGADEALGDVPLCFLSNADTTGGNSGSPALDGEGRLVGLNFDRVYENISGDYGYNPDVSRNIMVEIRAVLWYLEEVAGAKALLAELGVEPERRAAPR